jgi:hypothetical protein
VDWIKINCDGAEAQTLGKTSCGGVLRDYHGAFIVAFSCSLNRCSITCVSYGAFTVAFL